jgi:multicomponent Na+:H+ antiporter subunit G
MTVVGGALVVVGSLFCFLAAVGVLRFPDVFTRMHAATKAGILGAGLIVLGAAMASGDLAVILRAVVGMMFLVLTGPVSAHLLARAALAAGITPITATSIAPAPKQNTESAFRKS